MSSEAVGILRKETGRTMEEIRESLYSQYGGNYAIKSQKQKYHEGLFGLFRKPYFEVQYTVTNAPKAAPSFVANQEDLLKKLHAGTSDLSLKQIGRLDKKVDALALSINDKLKQLVDAANRQESHPSIKKISGLLEQNEFSHSYIEKVCGRLNSELPVAELDDFEAVQRRVVEWIADSIRITSPKKMKAPHIIALVGPTGVGKTTTVSKLAALFIKNAKQNDEPRPAIKMITTDRTRVGAVEQLSHFGSAMGISVEVAGVREDFEKALENSANFDIILVDTSGYGPKDYDNIGKNRSLLSVKNFTFDFYLVVSATTKAHDMRTVIQNYEQFSPNSVIVTKIDETDSVGNIISALDEKGKSISFVCDGQIVAKDIKAASRLTFLEKIADFSIDKENFTESDEQADVG